MILAIDMGNTNIVLGGIDEKQTYFIERVTTDKGRTDTLPKESFQASALRSRRPHRDRRV